MIWCYPTDRAVVVNVAVPAITVAVPRVDVPSLKVTVPVAVLGAMLAVNVTACPTGADADEVVRTTDANPWLTVSERAFAAEHERSAVRRRRRIRRGDRHGERASGRRCTRDRARRGHASEPSRQTRGGEGVGTRAAGRGQGRRGIGRAEGGRRQRRGRHGDGGSCDGQRESLRHRDERSAVRRRGRVLRGDSTRGTCQRPSVYPRSRPPWSWSGQQADPWR